MAAIDKSIYEKIIIESADQSKTVDIAPGVVSIDYYEDIFSPTITVKLQVVNVGNAIKDENNKFQSIYNGLPLRGGERISLKVTGNTDHNPGLDFSEQENYLFVSSITNVISTTEVEGFTLNLVSREALTNETSRVGRKYPASLKISETAKDIIKKYLATNKDTYIDPTQNPYGFIGNMRKPFTILTWLASKSVPESSSEDATAGYVFFETKKGYNFRSIDDLISSDPYENLYVFTEVVQSVPDNDFKIMKYNTNKNQNLIGNMQRGTYCSQRMFFNPCNFEYTSTKDGKFDLEKYKEKSNNLGKDITLPKINPNSDLTLGEIPTRNVTAVLDIGTIEKGVSVDENASPARIQSQALMRYNTILTQNISMTIPSNTNLCAGDIIRCQFPKVQMGTKKTEDSEQTGLYMIKELCHHFDSTGSYTSLKLIKDTFGKAEK